MRPNRFPTDVVPLSEFRVSPAAYVTQVRSTGRPLVLTQDGKSAAVLLDVDEYERLVERAKICEDVAAAERQLETVAGIPHKNAAETITKRRLQ